MIEQRTYVICDLCQAAMKRDGADRLLAEAAATAKKWRILCGFYGVTGHVCDDCAAGKTDEALVAMIEGNGGK
jgi:hypothetical protein